MMNAAKARPTRASIVHFRSNRPRFTCVALVLSVSLVITPTAFAQVTGHLAEPSAAQADTQAREQIQQDKVGYAAAIVARWQDAAKASGKWDANYSVDMFGALMKLGPENLLAAGQATSYAEMTAVLMEGSRTVEPQQLGDIADDLVYTPVNPCRIVDTRNIFSPIIVNTTRSFDVDGASFAGQGGFPAPCGIPFGVARAVAMNVTAVNGTGPGFFTAWAVGAIQPAASLLNFEFGTAIANSSIVPVLPGAGNDFNVFAGSASAHLIVDVLGYFAAPVATPIGNIVLQSAAVLCANGANCTVGSPICPASYRMVSGGFQVAVFVNGVDWVYNGPNSGSGATNVNQWLCQARNASGAAQSLFCWVICGRVPGR